jgi:hypothetical protein
VGRGKVRTMLMAMDRRREMGGRSRVGTDLAVGTA